MKKEIIISEEDFELLKEKSNNWDKFSETNLHIVNISLYKSFRKILGRPYSYPNLLDLGSTYIESGVFQSELKSTMPEDMKLVIEEGIEEIKENFVPILDENERVKRVVSELESKLNKIPNWIIKFFN